MSGIPQGSVLGPVLFVCFINDLPNNVSSTLHMYADDTKVGRRIGDVSDSLRLQMDLDALVKWSTEWQLHFNSSKCKVMHIGRRSDHQPSQYVMRENGREVILEETTEERDLGVWVDNELKFTGHIERAVAKGNQLLGLIRRSFVFIDKVTMKRLYTALVRPILEYGNVVCYPRYQRDIDVLESVQRRATRLVPGLKRYEYEERLRRLDLPSLVFRRIRGDAIETYKFMHGMYKIDTEKLLPVAAQLLTRCARGHSLKLSKRFCHTNLRRNFFGIRVVNLWNSLPEDIVMAPSVNCFKRRFDGYWGDLKYSTDHELFALTVHRRRQL